jgi:hypothetical protein
MSHKRKPRSVVTGATSVALAVLILVWCALAFFGVKVPAWAMWTMGGVIGKNLFFAVVLLMLWPARKRDDDPEALVENSRVDHSGIKGEASGPAGTGAVAGDIEQHRQRLLRAAWNATSPEYCEQIAEFFAARKSVGSQEIATWMREIAEQMRVERKAG